MSENGVMTDAPPTREAFAAIPDHTLLRVAMSVLAMRVERFVTLAMNFALFGAACWWPAPWRLAAAGGFALVVTVLLALRKER